MAGFDIKKIVTSPSKLVIVFAGLLIVVLVCSLAFGLATKKDGVEGGSEGESQVPVEQSDAEGGEEGGSDGETVVLHPTDTTHALADAKITGSELLEGVDAGRVLVFKAKVADEFGLDAKIEIKKVTDEGTYNDIYFIPNDGLVAYVADAYDQRCVIWKLDMYVKGVNDEYYKAIHSSEVEPDEAQGGGNSGRDTSGYGAESTTVGKIPNDMSGYPFITDVNTLSKKIPAEMANGLAKAVESFCASEGIGCYIGACQMLTDTVKVASDKTTAAIVVCDSDNNRVRVSCTWKDGNYSFKASKK